MDTHDPALRGLPRPAWAAGSLSEPAWSALLAALLDALGTRGLTVTGVEGHRDGPVLVLAGGGVDGTRMGLGSLVRAAALTAPSGWETLAASLLDGMLGANGLDGVRPADLRLRIVALDGPTGDRAFAPYARGLGVAVAVDRGAATLFHHPDDLVGLLGRPIEDLAAIALGNLRRLLRPVPRRVGPWLWRLAVPAEQERHGASALLLLDGPIASTMGIGTTGAVVAIPTNGLCLVSPLGGDPEGMLRRIVALAAASAGAGRDAVRPLCPDPLWWRGPDRAPERLAVAPIPAGAAPGR